MSKELFFEMRQEELAHLLDEVENGNVRALPIYAQIKQMKDLYQTAERQIERQAFDEAEEYPEKSFSEAGFQFEMRQGGTSYNYKKIKEWSDASAKVKEIEGKYKQAYLSYQRGLLPIDENGVELELPEVSYKKASLIAKPSKDATH